VEGTWSFRGNLISNWGIMRQEMLQIREFSKRNKLVDWDQYKSHSEYVKSHAREGFSFYKQEVW